MARFCIKVVARLITFSLESDEMRPNENWIDKWQIGLKPHREKCISAELVRVFIDFWNAQTLDDKSKTTRNRYSGALQALGGYLVEQSISNDGSDKTADDLFFQHVGPTDGPLIYHDNESWQGDIDMVCRKFYKYMKMKC